jgi:hypothetical protein
MKWVLIITTFYMPNVPLKITEQVFYSEQACFDKLAFYDKKFSAAMDRSLEMGLEPGFGYTLRCEAQQSVLDD